MNGLPSSPPSRSPRLRSRNTRLISIQLKRGFVEGDAMNRQAPRDIDDYIGSFPPEIQAILERIRATIKRAAPEAEEKISYQMPTFALNGNLIHFAAFKAHIGLFPPVKGDEKLQTDLARYQGPKGNLKFPLDEPIPYTLITRVVKSRVKEQSERTAAKRGKK
jgi:uncharacterized protein YdhG (YjbR/CyaY superfamily)